MNLLKEFCSLIWIFPAQFSAWKAADWGGAGYILTVSISIIAFESLCAGFLTRHGIHVVGGRRLVAVAFTLVGAFSIDPQLDQSLEALGFRVPDSLEVDFYTRELVGLGQPVQMRLRTVEHPHGGKAGVGRLEADRPVASNRFSPGHLPGPDILDTHVERVNRKSTATSATESAREHRTTDIEAAPLEDEAELRAAHAEGVALQAADARGWTPVLHAAFAGKVQSLRILMELLGLAALDARTPDGSSAIHLAATEGHVECLEALAALGGDLKATDSSGWTAVHAAAAAGQIRSCTVFSVLGLDLSCKTPEGWTPAHCAAMSGASTSMRILQSLGAKLDEADHEGETPAHKAAAAGHEECLRELCQLGAQLDAVDQNGRTPAHFAAAEGELACLKCLHELDVRLDTEDAMGETPLDKADIEEQAACVQFLQDLLNLERVTS
eukprot:s657_g11.t1